MKLPLPVKIFMEIAIACGIFVILVIKTPLFDRAVPEWVRPVTSTNPLTPLTGGTSNAQGNEAIATGYVTIGTHSSGSSSLGREGREGSRPRYTVPTSRLSYIYRFADKVPPSTIYSSPTDGSSAGGASASSSRPVNQIIASIARATAQSKQNALYIQPNVITDTSRLEASDIPPLGMDNTKNTGPDTVMSGLDILDQTNIGRTGQSYIYRSCDTPRGYTIPHGTSVYAYNTSSPTIYTTCQYQVRSCHDGKLSGTYGYEKCGG